MVRVPPPPPMWWWWLDPELFREPSRERFPPPLLPPPPYSKGGRASGFSSAKLCPPPGPGPGVVGVVRTVAPGSRSPSRLSRVSSVALLLWFIGPDERPLPPPPQLNMPELLPAMPPLPPPPPDKLLWWCKWSCKLLPVVESAMSHELNFPLSRSSSSSAPPPTPPQPHDRIESTGTGTGGSSFMVALDQLMDVADDELAVIEASKSDESKFFFCLFFSSFRDVGHLVNAQSHFPSQTQFSLYICPRSSFFRFSTSNTGWPLVDTWPPLQAADQNRKWCTWKKNWKRKARFQRSIVWLGSIVRQICVVNKMNHQVKRI